MAKNRSTRSKDLTMNPSMTNQHRTFSVTSLSESHRSHETTTDDESIKGASSVKDRKRGKSKSQKKPLPPSQLTDEDCTPTELLRQSRTLIAQLKNEDDFPDSLAHYLSCLKLKLQVVDIKTQQKDQEVLKLEITNSELKARAQHLKSTLKDILENTYSKADMESMVQDPIMTRIELVETSLQEQLREIRETIALTNNTISKIQQETPREVIEVEKAENAEEATQKPSTSRAVEKTQKKTNLCMNQIIPDDPDRRTAIIKSRKDESGQELKEAMSKIKMTSGLVEMVITKRYSLHVICHTTEDREALKRELQQNRDFQISYNIINKPVDTYKIILINVPDSFEKEYIKEAILKDPALSPEDIYFLATWNNRNGGKNWLITAPLTVAKYLVGKGSILVGLRRITIRPHTSIQRCRRCQFIGHSQKSCEGARICQQCGDAHQTEEGQQCDRPPSCVNCKASNKQHRTRHSIDHPSSSANCPIYKNEYAYERERIDSIFDSAMKLPRDLYESHKEFPDHIPRRQQFNANNKELPPPRRYHQRYNEEPRDRTHQRNARLPSPDYYYDQRRRQDSIDYQQERRRSPSPDFYPGHRREARGRRDLRGKYPYDSTSRRNYY